jgi:hypothetical protein
MGNPIDKYRSNAVLEGGKSGSGGSSSSYLKSQKVPIAAAGVGTAATVGTIYKDMKNTQDEREAADEIKREKRGVEKTPTDYARDDAREIKMQEQTDKAADMASKNMAKGGTASSRADGCCVKGKTRGKVC